MKPPLRQIRAHYTQHTLRVYQAYPDAIADTALAQGCFVSPPFKLTRMSWIKPSFLWMMYRSGWGQKDPGQQRILAIDITREGFEWALRNSCLSHITVHKEQEKQNKINTLRPEVRVQWDPERDLHLRPLNHRSIQVGLSGEALRRYAHEWIQQISDISDQVAHIHQHIRKEQWACAQALLPQECEYPVPEDIAGIIALTQT